MDSRTPIEKNAQRLRVLRLAARLLCAVSTSPAIIGLLTPTAWKITLVHAVAALVYASIPLIARCAPLSAMVTTYLCGYAQCTLIIGLAGTGGGVSLSFLGAV